MLGRVGSVFVREARRQLASRHGIERAYHVSSSTLAPMFLVRPEMPTRSMQHLVSWSRPVHGDLPRAYSPFVHHMSTASVVPEEEDSTPAKDKKLASVQLGSEEKFEKPTDVSSYWGVVPKVQFKEDGTPWKWTCFTPHETYYPDVAINLEKTHDRKTYTDSIAYWVVKSLRVPSDMFFRKRYDVRAMMLETVAAVPGMVGGMLLHCKSLRKFQNSGGWIKALLEEAENERMHLMTFMEVAQPKWWERALVFAVQGVFFNAYFLLYLVSPKAAHRITGYLEEEAIYSYTQFLKIIDEGHFPNGPAPPIAIDYWRLPKDATIRDVVMVVRADEAHHRDVNHFAADILSRGKELRESPAPIGYH